VERSCEHRNELSGFHTILGNLRAATSQEGISCMSDDDDDDNNNNNNLIFNLIKYIYVQT
jgi:hypothetical protein